MVAASFDRSQVQGLFCPGLGNSRSAKILWLTRRDRRTGPFSPAVSTAWVKQQPSARLCGQRDRLHLFNKPARQPNDAVTTACKGEIVGNDKRGELILAM